MPVNLRRRVAFDKDVTLVGRANRLELWGRAHWEAEMDEALGYGKYDSVSKNSDNSRNGYSKKTIKTELGPVELNIPGGMKSLLR